MSENLWVEHETNLIEKLKSNNLSNKLIEELLFSFFNIKKLLNDFGYILFEKNLEYRPFKLFDKKIEYAQYSILSQKLPDIAVAINNTILCTEEIDITKLKYLEENLKISRIKYSEQISISQSISFLNEKLILINPYVFNSKNNFDLLNSKCLCDFQKIWAPEPYGITYNMQKMKFWNTLDLFFINKKTILVDEYEINLMNELEKHDFVCIPVKIRKFWDFNIGFKNLFYKNN